MRLNRVVVTGLGAVTGNAASVPAFVDTLMTGKTAIRKVPRASREGWPIDEGAEIDGDWLSSRFSTREQQQMDRDHQIAVAAVDEALASSGLSSAGRRRAALTLGFIQYFGRASLADRIAADYGLGPLRVTTDAACSAGAHAVGVAFRLVQQGLADVALAVGYNTFLYKDIAGLYKLGILTRDRIKPFDRLRSGTQPGEAAGAMVLESLSHAEARGAPVVGEMLSFGTGADAHQIVPPDPRGVGMRIAMERALEAAGASGAEVDYVNAHGTGTKLNDPSETAAVHGALGDAARRTPVSSTKPITGHTLSAAGIIEAIAALLATRHDFVPPTLNYETFDPRCDLDYVTEGARRRRVDLALSNSSGFGGIYSTIAFRKLRPPPPHRGDSC